ncbi:pyridoxal-dependent decarboxylase, exosortase A system-associated [Massilia sp. IC2-278]|uniref:pyridoxal-dependent decarboxylase, exosortase A system-associated n=1 Tax=Massilia sp. IC2-278 TaxID=2887200 RepID=UPI001E35F8DF|nr:pyridoxal-dependent decarboxylase, exosortase A system-associated [Massilia sp. IC2-278]MCC2959958.1 pyridoxal-dependent decarboxylase, exosortase A system-associated [Massilia sp. IC2-278]
MNAKPVHAAQTLFPVVDDCLQVGGIPLTRLAQRVGSTPFYAYDRRLLSERVAHVRAHIPPAVELHFSMKANPMPALVQHMAGLVDGIDVASGGELKVALDTGMEPARISFAGPGKSDAELTRAVAAGIVVHAESEREIRALARIGNALGIAPLLVLRINPDFELKGSGMRMGGGAKQFGIDAEEAPRMLALAFELGLSVLGFHIFSGSQSLKAEAIVEAQAQTLLLAERLAAHARDPLRILNIGGGFGIPYFPGEAALDLAPIGAALEAALPRVKASLPDAQLSIELGRYLVGEAGVYVARVVDRKVSRGQVFLVTDGGLHHHLAASGNFGQVIRKNYPVAIGNRMGAGAALETASVVGPLCTPLDLLGERMELPQAEVGDLVVVFQSGAYGRSASPQGFLSHPDAPEVLV